MVTIKMLAQACNVSIATVSKALNGASDVSKETVARIRKTADQMGYIPNAAARYMRAGHNYGIGVIFDDRSQSGLTHEFFNSVLESFKRKAENLGYDITLISNQSGPWGSDYASHVQYRKCAGVLFLVAEEAQENVVKELLKTGVPVVSVDFQFDNCSRITSDNMKGISDLVRYVYSKGHRKIAYVLGDEAPVTRIRFGTFLSTCRELGLEIPDEYIIQSEYHMAEKSEEVARKLLELPDPPTCILFPDDICAVGGLNELRREGLSVPEDVSIAGFDGILISEILSPQLTTVRQNMKDIGTAAAEEMVRAIESSGDYVPREIVVSCTLAAGGTVGPVKRS